ncbi:hypothetical protein E2I00_001719 [Balaenoptera physalus]|uniref:Fibrinogen C-terminal domain-containing protein n=1 Tax=Balaenoptera physalus TaxID=9770 RepID=A0A6A1QHN4_BALPH|nr:hypothetical protein E2I00_001719 [Balaenoptera physalus]
MIRLTLALWMDEVHQVSAEQVATAWRETSCTEALRDHRKGSKPPPPPPAASSHKLAAAAYSNFRKSMDSIGKRQYHVRHGSCSYTFLLPEMDNCRSPPSAYVPNAVQRDAPLDYDDSVQRLQVLENIMENNTQWLMKLENYIQDNMKKEMVEIQQNAVQNQTAVMIEIGTNLLNQTAEQTRKLTDVEAQVLNQTTRLELQLLEHSLSTNKLEKQILDQTSEINKLQDKNSFLEKKVLDMEDKHIVQLRSIKEEKDQLQVLVSKQNSIIEELEKQLVTATVNNSVLQKQQHDLMETVHNLLTMISTSNSKHSLIAKEEQIIFRDCAEAFKSGLTTSGIYTLTFPNSTEEIKAYCDMETAGGGWTVIQRREDGSVDFQRTWKEYKVGPQSLFSYERQQRLQAFVDVPQDQPWKGRVHGQGFTGPEQVSFVNFRVNTSFPYIKTTGTGCKK